MKPEKNQTAQVIALGILLALVAGFGVYRILGPKQKVAAKPKPPTTVARQQTAATPAPDQLAPQAPPTAAVEIAVSRPTPGRDPFAPAFATASHISVSSASSLRPLPAGVRSSRGGEPPLLGALGTSKMPPLSLAPLPGTGPAPVEVKPPEPEFSVSGVVLGERDVAILHSKESGRYIVREGQKIDGRYRVLSVSPDGVVLKESGGKPFSVKLGGIKNASKG